MEKLTWSTEKRKVSKLKPYPDNPREISKEQFHHLLESIEKFNYVELVAIDTEDRIIAGHMRVKALKHLKRQNEMIEVRVPSRELTFEEYQEYLVRSNLNVGTWDWEALANVFEPIDLLKWGFTEQQMLDTCKEAEEVLEEEKDNSSKKKKECPNCGHPL